MYRIFYLLFPHTDGHFSPVAAYHEERDMALILDVARFKYSPYVSKKQFQLV